MPDRQVRVEQVTNERKAYTSDLFNNDGPHQKWRGRRRRAIAVRRPPGLQHRDNTATALVLPVQTADEAQAANEGPGYALPVAPELADLLPWNGLRRGATVAAVGSTSLLMTLVAAAMSQGAWAAVIGMPGAASASPRAVWTSSLSQPLAGNAAI